MSPMRNYKIEWSYADQLSNETLAECVLLFNANYGRWGKSARDKFVGKPVRIPGEANKTLKEQYLCAADSWAVMAYENNNLIGYAFANKFNIPDKGDVLWVTQFVVASEHR